ncbi:MAG: DEAD/DEAH box helicase [Clostridia bacterium]|nr:DEAD/DEAH box helicase [Clostridia bacterium]
MKNNNQNQLGGFQSFEVQPEIIKSLDEQGIVAPTDIQREVIPVAIKGSDVVAQAPTGTGKTLAFVLPMLAKIDRDASCVQALVLCPTRELVIQICEVIQNACKYYERVRVAGLYGGQNIQRQLFCLRKKPQIVVGTPCLL